MYKTSDFDLRGRALALLFPILSAAVFAGISIALDVFSGLEHDYLSAGYLFQTSLTAAAGGLLSAALVAARLVILKSRALEREYLQIPWEYGSRSRAARYAKLDVINAIRRFFDAVDSRVEKNAHEELALKTMHIQLEEQIESLIHCDRLQFISPNPQNAALKSDSTASLALRPDGYGLIVAAARAGDVVEATDFQNSRYWWLNREIAFDYLQMNLDLVQRGVSIQRVFGRNHPVWDEDEKGAKKDLIELQGRIRGIDVFSIDYSDFSEARAFDIQPFDQLCLIRGGKVLPSIEWKVDDRGDTDKVFYVLGQPRLTELHRNFAKIKDSRRRGSTFRAHDLEKEFDIRNRTDYERVLEEFSRIAGSMSYQV